MAVSLLSRLLLLAAFFLLVAAQSSSSDGYIGYSIERDGDQNAAVYETLDTASNATAATLPPDVHLNASLHVGLIDIDVQNLTAQVNLAASVLSLLKFNAGVDISINQVQLIIQNVTAQVLLEARLENLVLMIDDVLSSLDLNPLLATLGQDVGQIVNDTSSAVGSATSSVAARGLDFDLANNILYSVNDYSGNTHTNRILAQNGSIVEQKLHNNGVVYQTAVVGNYSRDMAFNGYNASVTVGGQPERELEYVYSPFPGLSVVSAVFMDATGRVVRTQVLSESGGGGGSSIGGELKT